jgi:hypothetical protein
VKVRKLRSILQAYNDGLEREANIELAHSLARLDKLLQPFDHEDIGVLVSKVQRARASMTR